MDGTAGQVLDVRFGEALRRFKREPAYAELVARYREPGAGNLR